MNKGFFYKSGFAICLLLITYSINYAQQNNTWIFGKYAGLDFNSTLATAFLAPTDAHFGPSACVSDQNGHLLFYTNGDQVFNKNYELMPNGGHLINDPALPPSLSGDYIASLGSYPYSAGWTSFGATVIVPVPGSRYRYYVFSLTPQWLYPYQGRLYYSIVDMELDGGLGDVEPTHKCTLVDSGLVGAVGYTTDWTEAPIEVIRGEKCDFWLLALKQAPQQGAALQAYNINVSGIESPLSSPLGISASGFSISPDRTHIAFTYKGKLFDFDPASGLITSSGLYLSPDLPVAHYNDIAFSADGSKLYMGMRSTYQNNGGIDQYDLNAADIPASRFSLGNGSSGNMRLGPDGKIYISNQGLGTPFLYGTIMSPNSLDMSCDLTLNTPSFAPGTGPNGYCLPRFVPAPFPYDTFVNNSILDAPACTPVALRPSDTTGWSYLWNNGTTNDSLTVSENGVYSVQYFVAPCTYRVDSFQVIFKDIPIPNLGDDTVFCIGDAIDIPLYAPDDDSLRVLWSTGSAQRSIRVTDSGQYWVRVAWGDCAESDTVTIGKIQCQCHVLMPNAFSPNHDGINDLFLPVINPDCPGIQGYALHIYNRYGQVIYNSYKAGEGWDGTMNGKLVDAGTYFYEMTFTNEFSRHQYYKCGDITLIR